jgi:hypothetical protein
VDHTRTQAVTIDPGLRTPDREVFVAVAKADTSESRVDRYLDDISDDEVSANAPTDDTTDAKNARRIEDHVWLEDRWMVASLCDE